MVLVAAALVLVIVAVFLFGGGAAMLGLGSDHPDRQPRESHFGGAGPLLVIAGVVGVVLLLLVAPLLLVGLRTGGDDDETTGHRQQAATTPTTRPAVTPTTTETTAPSEVGRRADLEIAANRRRVELTTRREDPFRPVVRAVDQLVDGQVLHVIVRGFEPYGRGTVAQCRGSTCQNHFPVQFGRHGGGELQYQVVDRLEGRQCGVDAGCALVVTGAHGQRAERTTVFGAPAPAPPEIEVAPRFELADGQPVRVRLRGFRPGTDVAIVQCAPPASDPERDCGLPGPETDVVIGSDGTATVAFAVAPGEVGTERRACARGDVCGIAVVQDGAFANVRVVPLGFASGPGARYDGARVVAGLVVAVLLAAVATWLVRRTDWGEPTEAATPELDAAPLVE